MMNAGAVATVATTQVQNALALSNNSFFKGRTFALIVGATALPALVVVVALGLMVKLLAYEFYVIERLKDSISPIGSWNPELNKRVYCTQDIQRAWNYTPDVSSHTDRPITLVLKNGQRGLLLIKPNDFQDTYKKFFDCKQGSCIPCKDLPGFSTALNRNNVSLDNVEFKYTDQLGARDQA